MRRTDEHTTEQVEEDRPPPSSSEEKSKICGVDLFQPVLQIVFQPAFQPAFRRLVLQSQGVTLIPPICGGLAIPPIRGVFSIRGLFNKPGVTIESAFVTFLNSKSCFVGFEELVSSRFCPLTIVSNLMGITVLEIIYNLIPQNTLFNTRNTLSKRIRSKIRDHSETSITAKGWPCRRWQGDFFKFFRRRQAVINGMIISMMKAMMKGMMNTYGKSRQRQSTSLKGITKENKCQQEISRITTINCASVSFTMGPLIISRPLDGVRWDN